MAQWVNTANLVLSGGGIKGIAFVGAVEIIEKRGYAWGNVAGVSAGSLVGAYVGAGYKAPELKKILYDFDFKKIEIADIGKKLPVVERYMEFRNELKSNMQEDPEYFLTRVYESRERISNDESEFAGYRGGLLKNVVAYSKEGCLYDGDYLEEWIHEMLQKKGIRTFGDLRGGISDRINPRGYKVRMTAVDANRGRVVVIPDDLAFYGINPDDFEVSRAVRMSTSVPFVFKPVELKVQKGKSEKTYHMIDGGVFDNFPTWLIDNANGIPLFGYRLDGGTKPKLLSIDTPLKILKSLVSAVHDIGVPKDGYKVGYIGKINTSKVSFLDFGLSDEDKDYLYVQGKNAAIELFGNIQRRIFNYRRNMFMFYNFLGRRYFPR